MAQIPLCHFVQTSVDSLAQRVRCPPFSASCPPQWLEITPRCYRMMRCETCTIPCMHRRSIHHLLLHRTYEPPFTTQPPTTECASLLPRYRVARHVPSDNNYIVQRSQPLQAAYQKLSAHSLALVESGPDMKLSGPRARTFLLLKGKVSHTCLPDLEPPRPSPVMRLGPWALAYLISAYPILSASYRHI
ncbi:hypothetical protein LX36DRAFT_209671 [Colletotrichum falcatum]|nr:hypothetical protein LX36DRAFT_209671 [Colletotrichum falcatum]